MSTEERKRLSRIAWVIVIGLIALGVSRLTLEVNPIIAAVFLVIAVVLGFAGAIMYGVHRAFTSM